MKITRLFTGTDQKSHFEDIELKFGGDQTMLTTDSRAASSAVFRSAPVGLFLERHPAPRRQYPRDAVRRLGNRGEQRR